MVTSYVPAAIPEISSVVAALLQEYTYGSVPPATVTSTRPFAFPQVELCVVNEAVGPSELPTTAETVVVQPALSVTVTSYEAAGTPEISSVVAPLLQINVYGATPASTVRLTVPSFWLQDALVAVVVAAAAGVVFNTADEVVLQPFASVTVIR